MRGDFLHNQVLLQPIEGYLRRQGFDCHREVHVAPGRNSGYVDLLARRGDLLLAVEAELTPVRVGRDVEKAVCVKASHLLIVVPTSRLIRVLRNRFQNSGLGARVSGLEIWVNTPGPMITALGHLMSIQDRDECRDDNKSLNHLNKIDMHKNSACTHSDHPREGGSSCE